MSCFPFCIQIFVFVTTCLPQIEQSSFSDISLLLFSLHQEVCFLHMPFFVHPQVFSVAEIKPCFNLEILSTSLPEL